MPNLLQLLKIIAAIERRGLDFTKEKMLCPLCHSELKVYKTFDWDGETRIRYHKCPACGRSFKSIETRTVQGARIDVVPNKNAVLSVEESAIKKPIQKKQHKSKRKNKNKESEKQNKKRRNNK